MNEGLWNVEGQRDDRHRMAVQKEERGEMSSHLDARLDAMKVEISRTQPVDLKGGGGHVGLCFRGLNFNNISITTEDQQCIPLLPEIQRRNTADMEAKHMNTKNHRNTADTADTVFFLFFFI